MDRRQFFKLGLSGLRDAASKKAPDVIKPVIRRTVLDVSILSDRPGDAERLVDELLREHFGEAMLRLRQSELSGEFPGGVLLFENNASRDFHDGITLFYAALRQLEHDLGLPAPTRNPTLLRYTSHTPPFSRSVEVFHRDRLLLALPLAENGVFDLAASLGPMTLEVLDGRFRVRASRCRHRTCIAHPPIQTPGQRISCVPNGMTAIIGAVFA